MKAATLGRRSIALPLAIALLCIGAPPRVSGAGDGTTPPLLPWKLLFSEVGEVTNAWGQLQVHVTPVRPIRDTASPGWTPVGGFPLRDGAWEVFGQEVREVKPGDAVQRRVIWRLIRATTRDGATFDNSTVVHESATAAWTDHLAMAQNGDTGEYLLLKLKVDSSGFAYTAFVSHDGRRWEESPANPLFYDGDAMSLFWSPVLHRFVCVNKGLQPHRKHLIDHGGTTSSLQDDTLRDRRVLMMRSSPDGRRWEPGVSLSDVWNRNGRKAGLPDSVLTVPDPEDPPDLEFYSGNAFWYHDRAYMMVLNYAASPLTPRQHGPHLDNEWWTSRDGLHWMRPARGINALEAFPDPPRLETAPMILGGQILFARGTRLMGLPEDRISGLAARANAEFSTRPFVMPGTDLVLNASCPSPERPFARQQAYIRVGVIEDSGTAVPGYEPEHCVIREADRTNLPLHWGDRSTRALAGRKVRLRFQIRSATIFAVTTSAQESAGR